MIQIRLDALGVRLLRALNGMQGYWTALNKNPDVIICDYQMPEGTGNYVIGRLRSHAITKNIPMIALTEQTTESRTDFAIECETLNVGAVKFMIKLLGFPILLTELRRHIKLREAPVGSR